MAARLRLLLLVLIWLPCATAVHRMNTAGQRHPERMALYAHESRAPPSNTVVVSALPSSNSSGDMDEFGLIRTISNVLRDGEESDSTIVGSQVGIVVIGKDGANVFISFTYFLNANATYQGTIAVHGHIDGTSMADLVLAVVGGTGDFLSVSGVDVSMKDDREPADPANMVNVHNLTLYYPDWA